MREENEARERIRQYEENLAKRQLITLSKNEYRE
jgi:hypothetical protein